MKRSIFFALIIAGLIFLAIVRAMNQRLPEPSAVGATLSPTAEATPFVQAYLPLVLSPASPAFPGQETWATLYGGDGGEEMEGLLLTSDGNYLVVGSSDSFQDENGDAWIVKLAPSGQILWQKTYGGANDEYIIDIKQTADGGYIGAGWTRSFGAGQADFWLLKLDAAGNVQWSNTYGGPRMEQAWSVDLSGDGGYVVAGGTTSFGAGGADYWVLRLDAQGNIVWQKTYGGPQDDGGGGGYEEFVVRVVTDRDGGFVVASESASFGAGETDIWVLKLNPDGSVGWQKAYGGEYEDSLWSFAKTASGKFILPGSSVSFSPDVSGDLWVLQINEDGSIDWQKIFSLAKSWNEALSVGAAADGGALVGSYYEEGTKDGDLYLLRLDAQGTPLWQRRYEYGWDWPNAISQLPDGGFIMAGVAWPNDQNLPEDLWVMKLAEDGSIGSSCELIQPLSLQVVETAAKPKDTHATVQDTSVAPAQAPVTVRDTATTPRFLCQS